MEKVNQELLKEEKWFKEEEERDKKNRACVERKRY